MSRYFVPSWKLILIICIDLAIDSFFTVYLGEKWLLWFEMVKFFPLTQPLVEHGWPPLVYGFLIGVARVWGIGPINSTCDVCNLHTFWIVRRRYISTLSMCLFYLIYMHWCLGKHIIECIVRFSDFYLSQQNLWDGTRLSYFIYLRRYSIYLNDLWRIKNSCNLCVFYLNLGL